MDSKRIYDEIRRVGAECGFGDDFMQQSGKFWAAKDVLFHGKDRAALGRTAERYPLLASFNGDFAAFKSWYAGIVVPTIERSAREGSLNGVDLMRELKHAVTSIGNGDPTLFPFIERPMPYKSSINSMEGGLLQRLVLYMPNDEQYHMVVKRYPDTARGRRLYDQESVQKYLARQNYEVARPESIDTAHLVITYPMLKCNLAEELADKSVDGIVAAHFSGVGGAIDPVLADIMTRQSIAGLTHEEVGAVVSSRLEALRIDAFRGLVSHLAEISFDYHNLLNRPKPTDRNIARILEIIRDNELTVDGLVEDFMEKYIKGGFRLTHGEDIGADDADARAAEAVFREVAEMIGNIPKFPIHGDLFVGNVLVDRSGGLNYARKGCLKLHDFRFSLAPLQKDLFDLLNTIDLDEGAQIRALRSAYPILRSAAKERGIELFSADQFEHDYHLISIARSLNKAMLLYKYEKEATNDADRERHRTGRSNYFAKALQSMGLLGL